MLSEFNKLNTKPQNTPELKLILHPISDNLPDKTIRKLVQSFRKRHIHQGIHLEHLIN